MPKVFVRAGAVLAATCLMLASLSVTTWKEAAAQDPLTGYLMAHFTGESANGEQVYFAHSSNGLNWTDLNNGAPVLLSTVGTQGVRDPSLVRSPNGDRYWILATDLRIASGTSWPDAANNGSTSLVIWESTDLVNWSAPRLVNLAGSISGAGNAWAPEATYNPATGDYIVYWATNSPRNGVTKHRIWYSRTSNFQTFTAAQVWIDRAGSAATIDTQIIEVPNSVGGYQFYRASADGIIASDGDITIEAANSILGSWTSLGNLRHMGLSNAGFGTAVEGPMWMKFNGRDEWALWLDRYGTGSGYMPITSTNLGSTQNFQTRSDFSMGGNRKRHGSILSLTAAEESRVLAQWGSGGGGSFSRIQSYNYQDRYVRHSDFEARLDANVSPAADAQFRVVPGLADGSAGYVSFESVNFPGYYLRHYGFDLMLAANDGSSTFAQDATFRQVAGLASSSWSSFQSYNYPDRHIRHYGFLLRIDPINDAQARSDATFRLTS